MKIEKVNENQIRCTLTQQDLANRNLKLSELAYGTEKAKMLFHDMMQQANYEFGFEAEDIPLMIEAIPVSAEAIILLITKVEYPEELDTRFSKFSDMPEDYDDYSDQGGSDIIAEGADDILGLFRKISEEKRAAEASEASKNFVPLRDTLKQSQAPEIPVSQEDFSVPVDLTKMFIFHNLADISRLAKILNGFYDGENTLYKEPGTRSYYLMVHKSSHSPEVFNKVCNILSEYAHQGAVNSATEAYFEEHFTMLCANNALQTFATL